MKVRDLGIPGVFLVTPEPWHDPRGAFYEHFRLDTLRHETGRDFPVAQINYSVSRRNTLRGLHGVVDPPGQAKYVTCVRGALLDIVVDLRVGSPTFAQHVRTVLTAESGAAVLVDEGMGHGFRALTDDTCICYVLTTPYVPGTQFEINPLDPELALPWDLTEPPLISEKDATAPTLAQALALGFLPRWSPTPRHEG
ncbi:dTDP-4-dehydrorhamnose 3,5-epimerase family protein [Micromonospora sp. KC213]|uniref:dTDP-4-dehydrorhamnose 3,5-epimerase family protein n=1 Tax=Micromonospora sp. KC213 TaxID=2530378 RepID=UPI0010509271|nr:dTDP-4-dehydrorhamnose 3,5-epimerase family protein [Micromonospora sp. KC213]TDC42844.1 dTDP-4-keto-6-deoxy-D-glucose epimerase [Micromonospora sp. KC213]